MGSEFEINTVVGKYDFDFIQNVAGEDVFSLSKTPYNWGRLTTGITMKKMLLIFLFLCLQTALSIGVGTSWHKSTPRANVDMVKELIGDDLVNADASQLEDKLLKYLEDNLIEGSGVHAQLGLRFKVLMLDSTLTLDTTSLKMYMMALTHTLKSS